MEPHQEVMGKLAIDELRFILPGSGGDCGYNLNLKNMENRWSRVAPSIHLLPVSRRHRKGYVML